MVSYADKEGLYTRKDCRSGQTRISVKRLRQDLNTRHRDELKLLLYQAQGSSLENYIDEYTEACTQLVMAFMNDFKRKYPHFSDIHTPFTYHIHLVWMFSFISEIIKHQLTADEIRNAIEDYITFEFTGWRSLMNHSLMNHKK